MNFYVIKLKHIIIALLIFAVIPIIWFTTSRAVSVFNVNGREIPIYSVETIPLTLVRVVRCL